MDNPGPGGDSLTRWVEQIRRGSLLAGVGETAIRELLELSEFENLEPGQVLMRQDEVGETAYLVLAGSLDIIQETPLGQVIMSSAGPQAIVGEIAIFSQLPRTATVRAQGSATVLRLSGSDFRKVIARHPRAAVELLATLGRRIAAQNRPLAMLSLAAHALERADLDIETITNLVNEPDDVGPFALSLRKLLVEMETKQTRRQEMAVAAKLQQSILPRGLDFASRNAPFTVDALMRPAREIGGDFYDFFFTEDASKAFLLVADVSGKGVPAALFMAVSRTWLRASVLAAPSIEVALARANAQLEAENPECLFVTVFLAELEVATGRLTYVNAGHCDGYVVRADGVLEELPATAPSVGMMPSPTFRSRTVALRPRDFLLLVSDGVTEAFSALGDEFGEVRLIELLRGIAGCAPPEALLSIDRAVTEFAAGCDQSDDITCLALAHL
jgi:sigma-B regulation protein RsbU (phosphoserine phosphatase)